MKTLIPKLIGRGLVIGLAFMVYFKTMQLESARANGSNEAIREEIRAIDVLILSKREEKKKLCSSLGEYVTFDLLDTCGSPKKESKESKKADYNPSLLSE